VPAAAPNLEPIVFTRVASEKALHAVADLQRLITAPGYEFIHALDAVDSEKLARTVDGFFMGAGTGSTASATSSSSTSDGQPPKSSD